MESKRRAVSSAFQTVQALSEIVEKQSIIIQRQAEALAQMGALCDEETKAMMDEVGRLTEERLGDCEI